ncbi:MAG: diguanylate cyclase, partial [Nitrosopumilus sp.]|nr:diguanylate cyclase [Nitrosopumilus sp.]
MNDASKNILSAKDIQKLKNRVIELEQTLNTIQSGKVDALIIKNKKGEARVFTLEGSDQPYRSLVESMSEGAISLAIDGRVIHCNKRFSAMVNRRVEDIVGSFIYEYIPKIEHVSLSHLLDQGQKKPCKKEFTLLGNDSIDSILLSCHNMRLGTVDGTSVVATDITKLKQTEKALKKLARFDPLTQLPNRYLFKEILSKRLLHANRKKTILALFYIDIDNFKNVNDLFGHETGDILLIAVSNRLKQNVRVEDFIVRLGGDEFAIILEDNENISAISLVAERLINQFKQSFIIEKHEIIATLSIGISVFNHSKTSSTTIKQHADQALYQAKESGRNCYKYYNKTMQQQLERYMLIVKQLRSSLLEKQFELYYQPKINTQNNSIVGVEALIRWNNPLIGNSSPAEYIIIAEETGLINQIGAWVIHTALEQYNEWRKKIHKMENIKISINISANQLEDNSLM